MTALPPPPADEATPRARRPWTRRDAVGVLLTGLGLVLWALSFVVGGHDRSSDRDPSPPSTVELRAGDTYSVDLPGGVDAARASVGDLRGLTCEVTPVGGATTRLAVVPEADGTRALHRIATFVSPVDGRVAVSCTGLPAVFVDDAEDVGADRSLLCVVLGAIALATGLPLVLSALRRRRLPADEVPSEGAPSAGAGGPATPVR